MSGGGEPLSEERLETLRRELAEIGGEYNSYLCNEERNKVQVDRLRAFAREIMRWQQEYVTDDVECRAVTAEVALLASQERAKSLAEALEKYGRHAEGCPGGPEPTDLPTWDCMCGLDDATRVAR